MAKSSGNVEIRLGAKASAGMKNAFRIAKKNLGQIKAIGKQAFNFGSMAAAGSVALAGALTAVIAKSTATGNALSQMSSKLGIQVETLSQFQFIAQQTGVGVDTMNMALQRMVRRVSEAARGTGEAKGALEELGIDARKLAKMPLIDKFATLSKALGRVKNEGDKVRLSFKLFDSEGVSLKNTLALGEEGIRKMAREANELGNVWNQNTAKSAENLASSVGRVQFVIGNLGDNLAVQLMPAIQKVSDGMVVWFKANKQLINVKVAEWANGIKAGFDVTIQTIRDWSNDGSFVLWWERLKVAALGFKVILVGIQSALDFVVAGYLRAKELALDTAAAAAITQVVFTDAQREKKDRFINSLQIAAAKAREERLPLQGKTVKRQQAVNQEYLTAARRVSFLTQERDATRRMNEEARRRGREAGSKDADMVAVAMDARTEALRKKLQQDAIARRAAQVVTVF